MSTAVRGAAEEYPGLSAQRLFDEVRAAGYPGGYSRVRDYVRAVRPREPTESVVRFETPAATAHGAHRAGLSCRQTIVRRRTRDDDYR